MFYIHFICFVFVVVHSSLFFMFIIACVLYCVTCLLLFHFVYVISVVLLLYFNVLCLFVLLVIFVFGLFDCYAILFHSVFLLFSCCCCCCCCFFVLCLISLFCF